MSTEGDSGILQVLIIEDSFSDARLVRHALEEEGWRVKARMIDDGERAIAYAQQSGADASQPDLVILDLLLPKRHGVEVLQAIRNSKHLASVPVVVLSAWPQTLAEDVIANAGLTVECCLTKPPDWEGLLKIGPQIRACLKGKRPI